MLNADSGTIKLPPTINRQLPTVNRQPPTANRQPPTTLNEQAN